MIFHYSGKGDTLHTHLHVRRERFPLTKVVRIAKDIAEAVGYLHHRNIVPTAKSLRNRVRPFNLGWCFFPPKVVSDKVYLISPGKDV